MSSRTRDPLAAFNERVKLFSTTVNALGLGVVGFAVLRPLTESFANATVKTALWAVAGLALHLFAHYILRTLRKETALED